VSQEELDLFEFAAGGTTEFGAGAAEVVGLDLPSEFLAIESDCGEHGLGREGGAGGLAMPV
jgi:hypothetical protein